MQFDSALGSRERYTNRSRTQASRVEFSMIRHESIYSLITCDEYSSRQLTTVRYIVKTLYIGEEISCLSGSECASVASFYD